MQHLQANESDGGSGVTGQICPDPTGAPAPATPSVAELATAERLALCEARLAFLESLLGQSFAAHQRGAQ